MPLHPGPEVTTDEHAARRLGGTSAEPDRLADRRPHRNFEHAWLAHCADEGYQGGVSGGATGEQGDSRKRLHVLDQGRRAFDPSLEGIGRDVRGRGDAFVQEMDGGVLCPGDVAGRCRGEGDHASLGLTPLAQRPQHRVAGLLVALADVEHHASRSQHSRRD